MKFVIPVVFVLMCVAQWYVPGTMIAEQEDILRNGREFRFRTEPVDPSDPFRGKYITLDFREEAFVPAAGDKWSRGEEVFVVMKESSDGFAEIEDVRKERPSAGDYVQARIQYSNDEIVRLKFPFNRFYLEESKASEAEQAYWESRLDSAQIVYAVVCVKNGRSVLKDVMINDRSIVDIVRDLNKEKE